MTVSHRYFTVKSELEMEIASVIAMDFIKVFLLFLRLEQGSGPLESQNPPLVTPSSVVPITATNSAETRALFYGGQNCLQHLPLFSTIVVWVWGGAAPPSPFP